MGKGEINPDERIKEDSCWEMWVKKNRFCKADLKGERI